MVAVSLLKLRNPDNIQKLKQLLTFIPNPNHVKNVLKTAVLELIYVCPQSAFWLYQNSEVLEPEIKAREVIADELKQQLLDWGYTTDDFHFTPDQKLEINENAKEDLFSPQKISANKSVLMLLRALLSQPHKDAK